MTPISSEINSNISIKSVLISISLVFINLINEGNKNNKCPFFPFKQISDSYCFIFYEDNNNYYYSCCCYYSASEFSIIYYYCSCYCGDFVYSNNSKESNGISSFFKLSNKNIISDILYLYKVSNLKILKINILRIF